VSTPYPTPRAQTNLERLLREEHELALARMAVRRGLLAPERLEEARALAEAEGGRRGLGEILTGRGWVTPGDWAALEPALSREEFGSRAESPAKVPPEVADRLGDPARQWAEFVLVTPLGRGGAGDVWKAWDRQLGRWVALKILREVAVSGTALERFRREVQAAARLSHPNVVPIHRVGEERGRPYVVMPFVEGRTLEEARLPLEEALRAIRAAALAVQHAHDRGVVHRDLKPGNMMVDGRGGLWVFDFGLVYVRDEGPSALTADGAVLGTPPFMSPEQARGDPAAREPATDVYSLGATLYAAVTGAPPFEGPSMAEVLRRVREEEPRPPRKVAPALDRDVETIILKAMEKDPRRRYATAAELAEDLRRRLDGEPIAARPAGAAYRLYRRVRRNPQGFGLGAGIAAAALLSLALWRAGKGDREQALLTLREQARLSLDAALELRRAGANDRIRQFLPPLESAYRTASERAPQLAEADFVMGRMYRALMDDAKALRFQEQALRKDPRFAPALYERAVLLARLYADDLWKAEKEGGREESGLADRILRDCLDLEGLVGTAGGGPGPLRLSEANALAARGILAYSRGQNHEALGLLRKAVEADPLMEEAWEALAAAMTREAQQAPTRKDRERLWREAEQIYTRALAHDRGYLPHVQGRAGLRSACAYYWRNRGVDPLPELAAAEEDLVRVVGADARNAGAWMQLGDVRSNRAFYRVKRGQDATKDFSGAESAFARALEIDPAHSASLAWRGLLRWNRGVWRAERGEDPEPDFAEADRDFAALLEKNPRDPYALAWGGYVRLSRGTRCRERGEEGAAACFEDADRGFRGALVTYPEMHTAWTGRGLVGVQRGLAAAARGDDPRPDFAAAEALLTHVLGLDPEYVRAWTARGILKTERALYRSSRKEDPSGDFDGAEADFSRALEIDKEHAEGWLERGRLRAARREVERAARDYEEALRLNPALERRAAEPLRRLRGP
jgi:serine/threonine-protein kinase